MIIYRGRGIVVAGIAFGMLLLAELFTRVQYHDDTYYQKHGWPKLVGLLVAAGIVWLLAHQFAGEEAVGIELQSRPPRKPVLRPQDSLFFIPVRYWPIVLCGLGAIFYFLPEF